MVASIRRALSHPRSEISSLILEIDSVEKVGDWAVEIATRQPYPILLNKLSFVLIVPQDAPSVIEVPVGTGPYRFENQSENRIEVRGFHDYWGSVPQIDTVNFSFIEDTQDRLDTYFRGDAHFVYGVLDDDLARYPQRTDYQLFSETSVYISYLQFRVDRPPFDNPLVRQAFNLAIDRDRLASETASHNARPASQFLSPQVFGFVPDLPIVKADPEKARALLVEAGYSEDVEWEAYFLGRPVEKALETQLAEVGIHIKPVFLERSVLFQKLERNEVDLLRSSWGCPGGDASEFFDNVVHSVDPTNSYGGANSSGYSNLLLDGLIEDAGRTFNVGERREIFARATSILLEDMPLIPLLMGDDTFLTSPGFGVDASTGSIGASARDALAMILRRRSRRSLRFQFEFWVTLLVATVIAVYTAFSMISERLQIRQDLDTKGIAFARLATEPLCRAYENYYQSGRGKFRDISERVWQHSADLVSFSILTTSGEELYNRSKSSEEEASWFEGENRQWVENSVGLLELESRVVQKPGTQKRFLVVMPWVEEWGQHRLSVLYEFSYASLNQATWTSAKRIALLAAFSLVLGIFVAILLAKRAARPIESLAKGARFLAAGDLGFRFSAQTDDEFQDLADSFNFMATRLSTTISDLELANQSLLLTNQELKRLDALKSDLLANVSHELRTPLSTIRGYSEALREELLGDLNEAQVKALIAVDRNLGRLRLMIDELLTFAQMSDEGFNLEIKAFDLNFLSEQVIDEMRASLHPEAKLSLEIPQKVPWVMGDSYRLSQVLENLLRNSVKFTPPEGKIVLRIIEGENGVVVQVIDTGIGMAPEVVDHIFDRFYQEDSSSTRAYAGIGLGLSIVQGILVGHEVEIVVESEEGVGTEFSFVLPVAEPYRLTGTQAS